MDIRLKPHVAKLLKNESMPEEFVNDLILAYLDNQLIPTSEIAGVVNIPKVYRPRHMESQQAFDVVSRQFRGAVVEKESESLFICDDRLHDLLEDNSVILVMKASRKDPIILEEPDGLFEITSQKCLL